MQIEWWIVFAILSALVFGCLIGLAIGVLCAGARQTEEQDRLVMMQRYGKVIE